MMAGHVTNQSQWGWAKLWQNKKEKEGMKEVPVFFTLFDRFFTKVEIMNKAKWKITFTSKVLNNKSSYNYFQLFLREVFKKVL